jgi:uncharacterized protein YdaU (DUF1376 family)
MKIRRIDFSPDEWIAGTQGMTLEEEGAYCRMIMRYYSRGEALPADPAELAHLCNVRPQVMRRMLVKLAHKFDETDGKLRSNRCETELKLARTRLQTGAKPARNSHETTQFHASETANSNDLDASHARTGVPPRARSINHQLGSDLSGLKAKEGSEPSRTRAREGAWGASLASPAPNHQSEAAAEAEREARRQRGLQEALAELEVWKAAHPEFAGDA